MKKLKRITSIFFISMVCLLIFSNFTEATYTINQLKSMYPTGMQWNDSYDGSTQCHGFAGLIYDSCYGINPFSYAEVINDVNQVQAGDIVRYNGHSVFVLTRSNNNVTVTECNYDWNNHVRWDQPKTINEFSNNFEYILKAPYILGTSASPTNPQNVFVDITSGVTINWSRANNCYAYKIEIYNSSNEKVKELEVKKQSSISSKIYNLETGTYTVRVYAIGKNGTLSGYGSTSFSCQEEAKSVTISPEKKVIAVGKSFKYNVALNPSNGIAQVKFYAGSGTDQSIIKIEEDGTITGLKEGTTKVYFNFKTSRTSFTNSYQVKVVKNLKLKESEKKLNVGEVSNIAIQSYSDEAEVKWSSSNSKVITVDNSGNITAIKSGTAKITAKQTIYNSDQSAYTVLNDYCTVTVVVPIEKMEFEQKYVKIKQKQSIQNVPIITPSNATNSATLKWNSSNSLAVEVDNSGRVTGVGNGVSVITASCGSISASYTVESREKYFINKVISKDVDTNIDLDLGDKFDGAELETGENIRVNWTSNNENVVSVFSNGERYQAKRGGFATLTASDERYGSVTYIVFVNEPVISTSTQKMYAGDLNGDYKLDQKDIDLLVNLIEKQDFSLDIAKLADINGDGIINNSDKELLEDIVINNKIQLKTHILANSVKIEPETKEIYLTNGSAITNFDYTIYPENSENKIKEWELSITTQKEDGVFITNTETMSTIKVTKPGTYYVRARTDNDIYSNTVKLVVSNPINKLIGDVNGDGKVNFSDYAAVLAHVKKIRLLTGEELQRADVNGDSRVNFSDYAAILAHVKKIKLLS